MQKVAIPRPSGPDMRAALALPASTAPRPGVIVIHEIFGLNRDIRQKAQRLASMGYVAVAPDLYDGPGIKPLCVMRALRSLNNGSGSAFDDLDATRAWLAARDDVDASRIGVIGFCAGGGFALLYAARAPLGAAAVFYGAVPKEAAQLDGVCPVVGSFGGRDRIFGPQGRRLAAMLDATRVPHDIRIYPEAGHSFMSDHRGAIAKLNSWGPMKLGYRPEEAEECWERVAKFFSEHLDGKE